MKSIKPSFFFLICAIAASFTFCGASLAQTPAEVPLKNADFSDGIASWTPHSKNKTDSRFAADNGSLRISRTRGDYFLRAWQDVAVVPDTSYEMSFRIKVEGEGYGQGWIIIHTAEGWLGDAIVYSPSIRAGDWRTVTVRVPALATMDRLRLNFAPKGPNTTVWIDDVTLQSVPAATNERPLIPALDIKKPRLDGKPDEGFWRFALQLDDFRVLGQPDRPADPKTRVMLAVHDGVLYIAYRMDEPNPAGIRANVDKPGNIAIHADDSAQTFISLDRKTVTQLVVSVLGHCAVGGKQPTGTPPRSWYEHQSGVEALRIKGKADRTDTGWTVELQVPLANLIGQSAIKTDERGRPIIYANFCRHRPQDKEAPYSNWARLTGNSFFAPDQFRPLTLDWQPPAQQQPQSETARGDFTWRAATLPEHMIVGEPVIAEWNAEQSALPSRVTWDTGDLTVDPVVRQIIEPGVIATGGGHWTIRCRLWQDGKPPRGVSAAQAERLNSDEAFMLAITPDGADVSGRTHAAVMRGLATLTLLCDNAKARGNTRISTGTMLDAPALPIRGWLLGAVTPDQIRREAEILFLLRYNTVMFDIIGYGDYARFPFESHPNLGKKTMPKEQWSQLADAIRAMGMKPLPMATMWARAGYIAHKQEYKHLAVRPDLEVGTLLKRRFDKNLSAAKEESYSLVFDLLDEIVETMDVENVHLALDEVHYDDLVTDEASKKLGLTKSDWLIRVVNRTRDHLAKRGVRMWMWADNLDPGMHGGPVGWTDPEMLAKLPKDVVMHDWKYEATGPFTSIKMFKDAGFTTVSASWWQIPNVVNLIGDTARYGADGFIGTSWGTTVPSSIYTELATAMPLGAYLSWSPQVYDRMEQFPVVPAELYQTAAYRHAMDVPAKLDSDPVRTVAPLTSGQALIDALGLPGTVMPEALRQPLTGPLGCRLVPLSENGRPAAALVHGDRDETITIPLNGTALAIAMLHVVNRQAVLYLMHGGKKAYKTTVPVRYVLEYADGSTVELPVEFRRQINSWDDRFAAAEAWPVLFGTIADAYHFNVPSMLWINPRPDQPLKALRIMSGNQTGMDAAVFALTLLR
jgi:hypothetical protein